MLILVQSAILVQGTCNGFGKSANFIISFLEDIPDEDIENITLAVKQASSQVFFTSLVRDHYGNT